MGNCGIFSDPESMMSICGIYVKMFGIESQTRRRKMMKQQGAADFHIFTCPGIRPCQVARKNVIQALKVWDGERWDLLDLTSKFSQ